MIPHWTQGSYWQWRCGTFNFKIRFIWLCCHGVIVSTLRVSKAHFICDLPSQHKCKIPELSNVTSFDSGVLLVVEIKIRFVWLCCHGTIFLTLRVSEAN
jgi:hypothetical protein